MIKKLYHGSNKHFDKPDLSKARNFKDFGKGFYLTTNLLQAENWAVHYLPNNNENKTAYVYEYDFQIDDIEELKVLKLLEYNKEWLEFIAYNRTSIENSIEYDLVFDKMADGTGGVLAQAIRDYRASNKSNKDLQTVLDIAMYKGKYRDQYCFKTIKALEKIKRKRYAEVYRKNCKPEILRWHEIEVNNNE